ncbi:hypothetical protein BOX15_Mlig026693g1 [Macrostomum lignano]|uniref:CRAL-TRIO domain-containing protein n=1 Tax=Macrostomum lignano TaxID=282301 RepID=A0A267H4F6_9PLAT|nr:hypothetical protein BOX15_Mlig026693g1 [Macrostomum lignano]
MLRQQLRAAAVRAPPRSDQAELLQAEAERLVAGVLEAAIDVLAEELVPELPSMNGPTKCKNSHTTGPQPPQQLPQQQQQQQQQQQPDSNNDQHLSFLTEIASRMVNSRLNDSQLSSAVEQLTRHRSEFRLPEARPKSERSTAVDLALLGPYLRCLSHAGVLSEGCGPAATLLVFDASRLPDCDSVREYDGIMLQLLTLLSHAIRQIRTPSFALVFLHSPATRGQFPKVAWMKQATAWLETQSSLRRIYVLHSTFSLSTLSVLSRAFTSRAFRDLVTSVSSVQQLQELLPLLTTSVKQQLEAVRAWESTHKGFGF